jgi:hypothetical protein
VGEIVVGQFDCNTSIFLETSLTQVMFLHNGQIHNAYQYMLNGSPSIGKITRGKTHELIIQMHGEVVTWIDQIKQKLCLGGGVLVPTCP